MDPDSHFHHKHVIISGGLGFIGSNLAIRLVRAGAKVTLVDSLIPEYGGNLWNIEPVKEQVQVNISDVRDDHSMRYLIRGKDYFFNLAGQTSHLDSMENPFNDLEINVKAQLSILETCRKYNPDIKIIFASTRQIYGVPQYLPVDEGHPLVPVDVNGINKLSGEMYHILYNRIYNIRSSVLRLTNTYGPRMRIKDAKQTFLGIWIRNLLENNDITIYGDGSQLRDYNFIDDVIDAFLLVASIETGDSPVYNLGNHIPFTLKETAEIMVQQFGAGNYSFKTFPTFLKKIDIGDYYSNYRKISEKTGWLPKVDFQDGIKETLEFFRENYHHYI